MKNFIVGLICVLFVYSPTSRGELPPKIKVLLVTSAYGAAAGALLGTASLAFKAKGRAVAQGASLGLYAGIIFGTYVIASHAQRNSPGYEQGPQDSSPYSDDNPYGNDYYGTGIFDDHKDQLLTQKKGQDWPLYMQLAQFSF